MAPDNKFELGLTFCVLVIMIQFTWSQNNTTIDSNTTAIIDFNTTSFDNTTTPVVTTLPTTTIATTTTISPSVPGTTIPANTDVSKCPCDLTGNACDIGCCCDPDCDSADTAVFAPCLPYSYVLDDKLCFDRDVFFLENGPTRSGDSGGLFCIYYDNDVQRNYYTNPSLVTTEAEFLTYAAKYKKFSFQSSATTSGQQNFSPFYKSGDPIYVVFPNDAFSFLALPSASTSFLCTDSNPAAYLVDASNVCARIFSNLSEECSSNPALNAATFYENFRIIKDTFLLQSFNTSSTIQHPILGSVDLSGVTSLYNNSYTLAITLDPNNPLQCIKNGVTSNCIFTTTPVPTYNDINNTCQNALVEVHYRFVTNGTIGIDNAYVRFVFKDLDSPSVTQTFSATFSAINSSTTEPIQRSGNPGYQIGKPIIAGVFNITTQGTTTQEKILLTSERGQQLTLIKPTVNGDCLTDAGLLREPVLFGQDMRTGCFISIQSANAASYCVLLQQAIINAIESYEVPEYDTRLNVYPKNNRYVAMFGDSDVGRTGDWVEILFPNRPPSSSQSGTQCVLSLGANIQILYANVGSLPNPQAKIIGVAYVYDKTQPVSYRCSGPFCQPGSATLSQKIEVSSSVSFIDVSSPPIAVEGLYPTFAARLPYDFFYPFLNTASRSLQIEWCMCWFFCVIVIILQKYHI